MFPSTTRAAADSEVEPLTVKGQLILGAKSGFIQVRGKKKIIDAHVPELIQPSSTPPGSSLQSLRYISSTLTSSMLTSSMLTSSMLTSWTSSKRCPSLWASQAHRKGLNYSCPS